ncbi:uncharacterized protein LOC127858699 [Dreissena polymorpha]|uniref:Uncharacterized protein n=1 Tax=Dreissena polymorpha TaxID=45954 RepID=A0A9D3Z1W4_DREPO|nr:uncharacterized protein LOC127858699 [Dreissena polymorpha]KAH3711548.1 hypothetical protein DPMN_071218 [Dreissena polymorpha]
MFIAGILCICSIGTTFVNSIPYGGTGNTWHIHVTMHVFSGRPDPSWLIPDTHGSYDSFLSRMKRFPNADIPTRLGYRGFTLVHVPPGERLTSGQLFNVSVTSFPDWEMELLATSAGNEQRGGVDEYLRDHSKRIILQGQQGPERSKRSLYDSYGNNYGSLFYEPTTRDPIFSLTDADMYELAKLLGVDKRLLNQTTTPPPRGPTKFEPTKWRPYFVQEHNNCYNYVNNRITDTFAQPGRSKDECGMPDELTGNDVKVAAICDGLQVVPARNMSSLPEHDWNLVALVFWPPKLGSKTFDFHWYRLDGDGTWSHKPGKTSATNVDDSGQHIRDPRHADRGEYTEFIAFMETRQDKVLLI